MTDDLFFDTDCLSAFLWINDTNILQALYAGKIVIRIKKEILEITQVLVNLFVFRIWKISTQY